LGLKTNTYKRFAAQSYIELVDYNLDIIEKHVSAIGDLVISGYWIHFLAIDSGLWIPYRRHIPCVLAVRFPVGLWTDGRQVDGRGPQTVPCERYDWRSDVVRSGRVCRRTTPRMGQVKLYERRAAGYHTVGRVWRRWSWRSPHGHGESVAAVGAVAVAAAATGNARARACPSPVRRSSRALQFVPRDGRRWRLSCVWTAANDSPTGTV